MYRTWKSILAAVLPVLISAVTLSGCDSRAVTPLSGPSFNTEGTGNLKRVKKSIPVFTKSATIDSKGGEIEYSGYKLTVPAGAVDVPTVFVMTSRNSGYLELELTATAVGSSLINNIGATGFKVPLSLRLHYDESSASTSALLMVWVRPDGVLEPVPTEVHKSGKMITGQITHFSLYGVGELL
ncbi:MAG: hypothetical protein M3P24_01740 [Gemmatimonadota bacterium]|nr:hypothetical protein [Gemmatimonadota bacterium]